MADETHVDLGFVKTTPPEELTSQYFPSKIGGKPSWLSLSPLPTPDQTSCPVCKAGCILLLQVYANLDDDVAAFHRTIFVFICRNPECHKLNCNKAYIVFRSQLPRNNDFYSPHPPSPSTSVPTNGDNLCCVCGLSGPKRCSKCHKKSYCSKKHQIQDWKNGHKERCTKEGDEPAGPRSILFPEFELIVEAEEFVEEEEKEKSESEKRAELKSYLKSDNADSLLPDTAIEDLEKMSNMADDKAFLKFKKRIDHEPEQVLRYDRGGSPLLVSQKHVPDDIPVCSCGAARQFEFQVMPQLLNHLCVDRVGASIDWGTLCVYTCSANCPTRNEYKQEFLWKQDYSQ